MSRLPNGLERLGRRSAYNYSLRTTGNEAWAGMDANCLGPEEARRHGLVEAAKRTVLVAIALASVAITAASETADAANAPATPDTIITDHSETPTYYPMPKVILPPEVATDQPPVNV